MLTAVSGAAIGTGFMFLMTSCGAALVFCMKKSWLQKGERLFLSLTAGVMLAASVWSLLIPAMEYAEGMGRLSFVPAVVGF